MMQERARAASTFAALLVAVSVLAVDACSGGGSSVPGPNPQSGNQPQTSVNASVPLNTVGIAVALPSVGGFSETLTVPANNNPSATLNLTISTIVPTGMPAMAANMHVAKPYTYIQLTTTQDVTMSGFPAFSITVPSGSLGSPPVKLGFYNPTNGWHHLGDMVQSGNTWTFAGTSTAVDLKAGSTYFVVPYSCGGPSPSPSPEGSQSPSPHPSPSVSSRPSASPKASPSASASASPHASPSVHPSPSPSHSPVASPSPSAKPSPSPTGSVGTSACLPEPVPGRYTTVSIGGSVNSTVTTFTGDPATSFFVQQDYTVAPPPPSPSPIPSTSPSPLPSPSASPIPVYLFSGTYHVTSSTAATDGCFFLITTKNGSPLPSSADSGIGNGSPQFKVLTMTKNPSFGSVTTASIALTSSGGSGTFTLSNGDHGTITLTSRIATTFSKMHRPLGIRH